ncbi:autotransporter outer membrane beta-barrel domain-containing protein [Cesiribacter sp. SM1]|uniref:autotransporter outer membrane beta-barrel domain-containing protein n=1 Tax=Cesiribacter sp. SM1 TaxID=2861196 RepID=UPI001CD5D4BD|nr:autotransporter outer membrane beta-barrel domain-containing protein [Cesiribacter sp. SM1]
MKKMLFAALVATIGFTSSAYAQFSAGTTVLGGSFSYSKDQVDYLGYYGSATATAKTVTISPRIGTFLADDFEAGMQVSYMHSAFINDTDLSGKSAQDMFTLAPYGRKYFSLNEWAGFYMQGSLGFGWGRSGGDDLAGSDFRNRAFTASLAPGVTIRVGEHVGIDFQANLLQYSRTTAGIKGKYADTKSDPNETVQVGPNFNNVSLGISFFL